MKAPESLLLCMAASAVLHDGRWCFLESMLTEIASVSTNSSWRACTVLSDELHPYGKPKKPANQGPPYSDVRLK